jgi:hypothetical protein
MNVSIHLHTTDPDVTVTRYVMDDGQRFFSVQFESVSVMTLIGRNGSAQLRDIALKILTALANEPDLLPVFDVTHVPEPTEEDDEEILL